MSSVDAPAVEVNDLVVDHGTVRAVDGLGFTAEQGRITVVLGPNGAGKTSSIEVIEGYRRPDGGSVRVLGLDPVADHRKLVRRMGVMLQSGGVQTGIRVEEVLRLHASFHDDPLDPEELMTRLDLSHRRRATWRTLSGGEQQRVSLALALIGRPDVVFLDEPTAGVDPEGRRRIRDMILRLRDENVAVVLTTHDLEEAERLADRVVIIDRGRLIADATPADLRRQGAEQDLRFAAPPGLDVVALGSSLGRTVIEESPGEYLIGGPPDPSTIAELTGWLAIHEVPLADLRAGRDRLEDVFLRLTGRDGSDADEAADPGGSGRRSDRRSGRRSGRRGERRRGSRR